MTEYLTEQEQIQQLKQLARQYIPAVIVGLLLAFALTSGWRAWQNHLNTIRIQASAEYDAMIATLEDQHNNADVSKQAEALLNQYPKTAYANLASLLLARHAVTQGNFKEAAKRLETVISHGRKTGLYAIARIRLARVKIADSQPEAALELLNATDDPAFLGLVNAVRGDALQAEHKPAEAAAAYRLAHQQLPDTGIIKPLLQMKYDNLPASTTGNKT